METTTAIERDIEHSKQPRRCPWLGVPCLEIDCMLYTNKGKCAFKQIAEDLLRLRNWS